MSSDFVIIGGGVIGLSIARDLHKRGAGSITIVDRGRIGAEASWAAAGMLGASDLSGVAASLFENLAFVTGTPISSGTRVTTRST